jgi:Protein of unknown function (DUF3313)
MKLIAPQPSLLIAIGFMLGFAGCTTAPTLPDVTPEGLTRVKDAQADVVYVLPTAQLGKYTKVALLEPRIAFRAGWQSDTGSGNLMNRISDSQMQKMIELGKKLLTEEFTKELTKGGFAVVTTVGPDVLAVKASIVNLDVRAPDPDNLGGMWTKTYTDGAGEATLSLELYDSVSAQLLAQAVDHKSDDHNGYSWRISRDQNTNINDARAALGSWAEMLVKGLKRAEAAK